LPSARPSHSDNSNTQFAALGLWAAGRHGLPLERPLALVVQRFRTSQTPAGGWGYLYHPRGEQATPSMTCAGLLGLAVGHGLVAPKGNGKGRPADAAVHQGLRALGEHIGKPRGAGRQRKERNRAGPAEINLYFLWSLERVGMLYNLRTIGGKDWYAWGAELLVDSQQDNGRWLQGGYPGATPVVNTCLALLFLKRANLATDLSERLEFFTEVKPSGGTH
jgi:hypothetical protein